MDIDIDDGMESVDLTNEENDTSSSSDGPALSNIPQHSQNNASRAHGQPMDVDDADNAADAKNGQAPAEDTANQDQQDEDMASEGNNSDAEGDNDNDDEEEEDADGPGTGNDGSTGVGPFPFSAQFAENLQALREVFDDETILQLQDPDVSEIRIYLHCVVLITQIV